MHCLVYDIGWFSWDGWCGWSVASHLMFGGNVWLSGSSSFGAFGTSWEFRHRSWAALESQYLYTFGMRPGLKLFPTQYLSDHVSNIFVHLTYD